MRIPFHYLCLYFIFRIEWMYDYQGMVVMATNQVWWTWEVEDVFRKVKKGDKMGMKNYAKKLHSQIDNLVVQVCVTQYFFFFQIICGHAYQLYRCVLS